MLEKRLMGLENPLEPVETTGMVGVVLLTALLEKASGTESKSAAGAVKSAAGADADGTWRGAGLHLLLGVAEDDVLPPNCLRPMCCGAAAPS